MAYIKKNNYLVGRKVILTEEKKSMIGKFTVGSVVTITEVDQIRGYSFEDEEGNKVIEAGFSGFTLLE